MGDWKLPQREFVHLDFQIFLLWKTLTIDKISHINVSSGEEMSIRELDL